jgi:DNA-binding beta-propeller fold protein YncE
VAPTWVAFSPDGKLLATVNTITSRDQSKRVYVNVMSVSSDGRLSVVGSFPAPAPETVEFSPDQRLLAAANFRQVAMYSVAPGGALTEVAGSPFAADAGAGRVAFTPDGKELATAGQFTHQATVFSVAGDGTLTEVGDPLTVGNDNRGVAFSPTDGFLAVAAYRDATLSVFAPRTAESGRPQTIGLRQTSSRRTVAAGASVTLRLIVANRAWKASGPVRTCVALPRGLSVARATPGVRRVGGRYCWTVTRLGSGRTRSYTITARARRGHRGLMTSRATATGPGSAPAHARTTVRIH